MTGDVATRSDLGGLVSRWADAACARLAETRAVVDALNVFPVADADTGTNMSLTLESAREALRGAAPSGIVAGLRALAQGAFEGAQGNSGVILAQLMRAVADAVPAQQSSVTPDLVADVLTRAVAAGYDAVGDPLEGTILTVARAAADSAGAAGQRGLDAVATLAAAADAAWGALARTPDQLRALSDAGVVDAGGAGLCLLLDSLTEAITGARPSRPPLESLGARDTRIEIGPVSAASESLGTDPGAPGYEVIYRLDADSARVETLRARLAEIGDSLVVAGSDQTWQVHVHVSDAGAAIEAGLEAGRPHRVRVTALNGLATPVGTRRAVAGPVLDSARLAPQTRGLVAFAAGPGLAALFRRAGAVTIEDGATPQTPDRVLAAILESRASEVVVLPNDPEGIEAAERAAVEARPRGVRVAVIPTGAQVQGLAAVAVRQPGQPFDDDVVTMTAAAGHTRHGAVTIATRAAITTAGPCRQGDTLGVVDGDFALVGGAPAQVAVAVVERLLAGGGELVTLVTGEDCDLDLVDAVVDRLDSTRPDVEVCVYDGGQPRYPVLIGVE